MASSTLSFVGVDFFYQLSNDGVDIFCDRVVSQLLYPWRWLRQTWWGLLDAMPFPSILEKPVQLATADEFNIVLELNALRVMAIVAMVGAVLVQVAFLA